MSNYDLRLHKPLGKQDLTIYTRAIYVASAYVHRMWQDKPGFCLDQEELDERLATLTKEFKIWHLRRLVYKLTGDKWRTLDEIMCHLGYYIWNTLPFMLRH